MVPIVWRYSFVRSQPRRSHDPRHRRTTSTPAFVLEGVVSRCDAPSRRPTQLAQWRHVLVTRNARTAGTFAQPRDSGGDSHRRNRAPTGSTAARAGHPGGAESLDQERAGPWPTSLERRARTFSMPTTASHPATTRSMRVMDTTPFTALAATTSSTARTAETRSTAATVSTGSTAARTTTASSAAMITTTCSARMATTSSTAAITTTTSTAAPAPTQAGRPGVAERSRQYREPGRLEV